MTSRLKHKLDLEQINLNSAYLNESFVQVGTPLPALATTKKDQLEYVPEWKQEVRDEQGRRRFHGAFTGGFSAGYYNTAGSKEGWKPATFKSSKSNRANKVQRAEDFMDEEDLAQMNEDRKLENTETFRSDTFGGTKEELASKGASAFDSLIAPARSSIGQTLLQKQGWRPGQGIGPRVTLRKLRIQEGKLGKIRVGMQTEDEGVDEEEAGKHTFAPRDTRLLVYDPKEERQGLGFEKGRGMGKLPSKSVFGAARPDDEDDDPYGAEGSGSNSRHFAFDNGEVEDEVIVMGGPSKPPTRESNGHKALVGEGNGTDTWHDGRPVLAGFALDPLGVPTDKWFEMPEIPPDWHPRPARVWGTTRKLEVIPGETKVETSAIRGVPGRPLTFEQRGDALGEEQRISQAKSVFEYISEKDKERLASLAAAAKTIAPPPLLTTEDEVEEAPRPAATEVEIPPLSPRTASAALRGFIPFGDDLSKQERYQSYLESQTYNTKTPTPKYKAGSIGDINKELNEFAASARIFKPMSFAMSSRFTSGSITLAATDLKQAKPGLHMYDATKMAATAHAPQSSEVVETKKLNPREQAAKDGIYGKLTRVTRDFYPVKLLCKRFGVADPHPEGETPKIEIGGVSGGLDALPLPKNDASWEDQFVHKPGTDVVAPNDNMEEGGGELVERIPKSIAEVGMAEDVNQGRETLTYVKPSIDIFKAIFASDDEDEVLDVKPTIPTPAKSQVVVADPYPVKMIDEAPVDLTTFKPVFTRQPEDVEKKDTNGNAKKEKRKKEKKRKGVLSFDAGEEGDIDPDEEEKRREEKKRKRESREGDSIMGQVEELGVVEEEWVEKASLQPRLVGRKGAADFM